jgi:hypothetical protein
MKLKTLTLGLFAAGLLAACDSPLDTNPSSSVPREGALDTPAELTVAVNGMYDAFQDNGIDFSRNLVIYPDLYADNLDFFDTYVSDDEVYNINVTSTNTGVAGIWRGAYDGINRANEVLAAIPAVQGLSSGQAAQARGEALFVRSYMYFVLAQFFGGVPLVETPTTTIPTEQQAQVPRSTLAQTYALIERDLRVAAGLLGEAPFSGRASMGAAQALLARLNLYTGDFQEAYNYADAVIESGDYELVADYAANWRNKNGPESIFEVQYTVNDPSSFSTWFHYLGRYSFSPTSSLYNSYNAVNDRERRDFVIAFSPDDAAWVGKYFRVESGDDNMILLRLAEMYLVRAEAAGRLGNLGQAIDDVNTIRARSGVAPLAATVTTQVQVLTAVLNERRRELAIEGHRFFDLRRMRDLPAAAAIVNNFFEEYQLYFPLPQTELDANRVLTQNPGY